MIPVQHKPAQVSVIEQTIKRNAGKIAGVLFVLPAIGAAVWQYGPPAIEYLMRVNDAAKQIGSLKADIQSVKEDVGALKRDVGSVKGDVKDVKGDIAGVKAETKKAAEDIAFVKGWIQGQDRPHPVRAARTDPEN